MCRVLLTAGCAQETTRLCVGIYARGKAKRGRAGLCGHERGTYMRKGKLLTSVSEEKTEGLLYEEKDYFMYFEGMNSNGKHMPVSV